jgi:hypothetical protein
VFFNIFYARHGRAVARSHAKLHVIFTLAGGKDDRIQVNLFIPGKRVANIIKLPNGDFKIAPTHRPPTGFRAWLGENWTTGTVIAGTVVALATLATAYLSGGNWAAAQDLPNGIAGLLQKTGFVSTASSWLNTGVIGGGMLLGGLASKMSAEKQAAEGTIIRAPTHLNRGVLSDGLFKGALNGIVHSTLLMTFIGWVTGHGGIAWFAAANPLLPIGIAAVAALWGAVRGSISRKEQLEKTYHQVEAAHYIQIGQPEKARQIVKEYDLGPAFAASLGLGGTALAGKAAVAAGAAPFDPSVIPAPDPSVIPHPPGEIWMDAAPEQRAGLMQKHGAHDFSHLADHPAHRQQRSFTATEDARRAAAGLAPQLGGAPS